MEKGLDEGYMSCVLLDERKILNLGRKYIRNRNERRGNCQKLFTLSRFTRITSYRFGTNSVVHYIQEE